MLTDVRHVNAVQRILSSSRPVVGRSTTARLEVVQHANERG